MSLEQAVSLPQHIVRWLGSKGIAPPGTLLVAFSGGADSTALLVAAKEAGFRPVALHCNFHLRGPESDRDEMFCRSIARQLGVELKVKHCDVGRRMADFGESVEMAARELRYSWFDEQHQRYDAPLLTAHHRSDNVETFFMNLLRGSGIRGLAAIPPQRGYIMRPLLDISRRQLLDYLAVRNIGYVTDSTNLTPDYTRNRIRLEVIPAIEQSSPDVEVAAGRSASLLRADLELLDIYIGELRKRYITASGHICLRDLLKHPRRETVLFHLLSANFSTDTIARIFQSHNASGKVFEGKNGARVLLDHGLLVELPSDVEGGSLSVKPHIESVILPRSEFVPSNNPWQLWLDGSVADERHTWELRHWHPGDRIMPFGMHGTRVIADILAESRIPIHMRPKVWVLTCDGEPVWVPGVRTSNRFRVTEASEKVIRLDASVEKSATFYTI